MAIVFISLLVGHLGHVGQHTFIIIIHSSVHWKKAYGKIYYKVSANIQDHSLGKSFDNESNNVSYFTTVSNCVSVHYMDKIHLTNLDLTKDTTACSILGLTDPLV